MQRFLLAVIFSLAVIATTYAETTCETHRRNSRNSAHGLNWNIECDSEGNYKKLQCTDAPEKDRWCSCYNKEDQVSGPSKKLRHCECALDKQAKLDSRASECDVPECARNGKYQTKRCCQGQCFCVNADTGAKTTEPSSNTNLQCS